MTTKILKNISLSPDLSLRLGRIPGFVGKNVYGYNVGIDGNERGVCQGLIAGEQLAFVGAASSFAIASTNVADTQVIEIEYFADLASQTSVTQNVTLNGQTKVTIGSNMLRIIKLTNTAPTNPIGVIYIGLNSDTFTAGKPDTNIHAVMVGESGASRMGIIYCPPMKNLYIVSLVYQSDIDATGDAHLVRFKSFDDIF